MESFVQKEIRAGYSISAKMKRVWEKQIDLVKVLEKICEKYNLTFFAIYGTLLGAIRHEGYIPWDDDIDVVMPRRDFEKLKKIAVNELKYPYVLVPERSKIDFFSGGLLRLRNDDTLGADIWDSVFRQHNGIWIDILALDKAFNNDWIQKKKVKYILFIQQSIVFKLHGPKTRIWMNISNSRWNKINIVCKILSLRILYLLLKLLFRIGNIIGSKYVGIYTHFGEYQNQRLYKEDFKDIEKKTFEYISIPVPKGYKRVLEMTMGSDYMQYPDEESRKPHHQAIFDPECSYRIWQNRFYGVFKISSEKVIVLFGTGQMLDDYMQKYGSQYMPKYLIDNSEENWGKEKYGIIITGPGSLINLPKENLHIIICNIYYRQIGKQLENMGFSEYYIYVQNKTWIIEDFMKDNEG